MLYKCEYNDAIKLTNEYTFKCYMSQMLIFATIHRNKHILLICMYYSYLAT